MNSKALAILIFLLGIIAAIILFIFMQFGPYQEATKNLDDKIELKRSYEDSLRQVVDVSAKIEQYKALLKSMEGLLVKAEAMVPKEADRNDICELLIELSHKAEINIISSTPSLPISSGDGTGSYMIPVSIIIIGQYSKIGRFLDLISNNQRILKISTLASSPTGGGELTVSMTINAYYLPALTTTQTSDAQWSD